MLKLLRRRWASALERRATATATLTLERRRHLARGAVRAGEDDARLDPGARARCWRASARRTVSLPGGCAIGSRPVDQHIKGLQAMGAEIDVEHGYIVAKRRRGCKGARITTDMVTVTGTENLLMAATLAEGETCSKTPRRSPKSPTSPRC